MTKNQQFDDNANNPDLNEIREALGAEFKPMFPELQDDARAQALSKIVQDVRDERARQDAQWGGPIVDDTRSLSDWTYHIAKQSHKISFAEGEADNPEHFRERFIKIAALAVAAVESLDRKGG